MKTKPKIMRMSIRPRECGLVLSLLGLVCALGQGSRGRADESMDEYRVGVARTDITPDYPIRLNGFGGRRAESEGVTQRIWAKSLAISRVDQAHPFVLVTVDSLGLRLKMVDEVAKRLARQVGLPRDHLAVTFSHSHTTPKVNGASDTIFSSPIPPAHQTHIDQYTRQLADWIEQVALAAIADLRPARLGWAIGRVGFAKNRRTEGGPVDHDLPMLVVRDPDAGVRAIYVTYACHCVTLSHNKISGDWAGYAQEAIERAFPGAVGLVSIGCGSDSNPSSGVTGGNVAVAVEQGGEITAEVKRLMQGKLRPVRGALQATLNRIDLPLDPLPSREQLEQVAKTEGPAGYNATWQLQRLDEGKQLLEAIDYPIQTWSFGESLAMVFLAGEVCVDYSLRLKRELDPQRIWVHGYSNDFCAYIPSERLRKEGGYGGGAEVVYFALPTTLRAGLERPIIDEVHRQIPQPFSRIADPQRTHGSRAGTPQESLRALRTHADLRVELVAAEPLVVDPVAIDFGPDGRLWVAEMRDYPEGVQREFEPGGVVKYLTDDDGDGHYDTAQVFLEDLPFPTGVSVWRKGVLICAAPDIIYAEDTTGDGRADVVKKLFHGFATHNYQARVNGLRYGLDNWVYAATGLFGGDITSATGQKADVKNRDFRIDPDTRTMEAVSGTTQQSRVRDDWGNWFGCDNGTLVRHYPLVDHYLKRNPHAAPPDPHVGVAPSNELFPIGRLVSFPLSGPPGRTTAACGLEIYRDNALGERFTGNTFTCEPVNQLVHRLIVEPWGATFRGHRAAEEQESEFLVSSDNWFRPVQVRTGPDGALWVVDMVRYVIEHPRWIPKDILATLDVRAGDTMGRIYRVVAKNNRQPPVVRIDRQSTAELVTALDQTNGTRRDLAQQLLIWRDDPASLPLLRKLVHEGTTPMGRLHALCTLDGLGALDANILIECCRDPHRAVRRHAVRLAEPSLESVPELMTTVRKLVDDVDTQVQLQLAYTLGVSRDRRAASALVRLALQHASDDYFIAAVMSSLHADNIGPMMAALSDTKQRTPKQSELFTKILGIAAAMDDPRVVEQVVTAIVVRPEQGIQSWQLEVAATLIESLKNHVSATLYDGMPRPLTPQRSTESTASTRAAEKQLTKFQQSHLWRQLVEHARQVAFDENAPRTDRIAAMRLFGLAAVPGTADFERLTDVLSPQNSPELQLAVVSALTMRHDDSMADILLSGWSGHTPAVRAQILDAMLSRTAWTKQLLQALGGGDVKQEDIDPTRRQQLRFHSDPAIVKLANSILVDAPNLNRAKVIREYQREISATADVNQGRQVFRQQCATCHRLEGVGYAIGPDLAALTGRSTVGMLVDILDPNRAVDARYRNYLASTHDGETVQGLLANETSTSVTLAGQDGKRRVILRRDLDELLATGLSLMPVGFEKEISVADMGHLLGYLESVGARPKQLRGNHPETIRERADGRLLLLATEAAIYGGDITFELPFRNIGYWHGAEDHVVWQLDLKQAREWDVYLDWACADESAGNAYVIQGETMSLRGVVAGTGGYDKYMQTKVGTIQLNAGPQRIILQPDGLLKRKNLMDCRGLQFVPTGTLEFDREP